MTDRELDDMINRMREFAIRLEAASQRGDRGFEEAADHLNSAVLILNSVQMTEK